MWLSPARHIPDVSDRDNWGLDPDAQPVRSNWPAGWLEINRPARKNLANGTPQEDALSERSSSRYGNDPRLAEIGRAADRGNCLHGAARALSLTTVLGNSGKSP